MDIKGLLNKAEQKYYKEHAKYDWFDAKERPFKPALKFYKKLQVFKASNVEFNPRTFVATSYRWWNMVEKIGGKVIFNKCRYSSSTSQHQSKVKRLFEQLGIKIDLEIVAPRGLQRMNEAVAHYEYEIKALQDQINNPRSRKGANIRREAQIRELTKELQAAKQLAKLQGYNVAA